MDEQKKEEWEEWKASEVTRAFFNTIREAVRERQEAPRYSKAHVVGDKLTPMTIDAIALENAFQEGVIHGLREVLDIELGELE